MKRSMFLFAIYAFVFMPHLARAADDSLSIQAMTYNIRYNNPDDGINAWPNRSHRVAEMIGTRYHADFAGLQEAKYDQIQDLEKALPDYGWFGAARDDGDKAGEFCPIFYRKDRFELLKQNTFWLSETPDAAGSKSWNSDCVRIVTWGQFRDKKSGKIFYHFNTHFDHRSELARVESAKLISKKAVEIAGDSPAFLTGDFNTQEKSQPYSIIVGKESIGDFRSSFQDARYLLKEGKHEGPTSTFTMEGWTKYGAPETKIDFIFILKGFAVLRHRVLDDQFDGRFPSDHLPVLAEIELQ
ncbi:MAG: endonuclease/exonuclease/phosphatase family protein [Candidatus Omnitrophota bacterium]